MFFKQSTRRITYFCSYY
uniref:Uncharacterized protein n=1 Tax=Rhizophora mucronata TaxID=61149 RepID=A0A2P2NRG5_RHIMU